MPTASVIFDLDGTLVDSLPGIQFSVDSALESCRMPPRSRELRELIGPPIRRILSIVTEAEDGAGLDCLERAFRESYNAEGWRKTLLHEGARDILKSIHGGGIPIFIATNKPAAPTRLILEELGIGGFFREVNCRDSVDPAYPSKGVMLAGLIERHGLDAGATLFVGDSLEDYEAGLANGLKTVIVSHGYGGGLASRPGFLQIDRFAELPIEFL